LVAIQDRYEILVIALRECIKTQGLGILMKNRTGLGGTTAGDEEEPGAPPGSKSIGACMPRRRMRRSLDDADGNCFNQKQAECIKCCFAETVKRGMRDEKVNLMQHLKSFIK
jgi:hypothetical protein